MSLTLDGRLSVNEPHGSDPAAMFIKHEMLKSLQASIQKLRDEAEANEADAEIIDSEKNYCSDADRVIMMRSKEDGATIGWDPTGEVEGTLVVLPYILLKPHDGGWALVPSEDEALITFPNICEVMIHIMTGWFNSLDYQAMAKMTEAEVERYLADNAPIPAAG